MVEIMFLQIAASRFSRQSNFEIPVFSLPNFSDNFTDSEGIIDTILNEEFEIQVTNFKNQVD